MNFFEAVESRYSYRGRYTDAPVPEEDVKKILDAGMRAPSGCNAQTTYYYAITNKDIHQKLIEIFNWDNPFTAPVIIVVATEKVTFDWGFDCELEDYSAAVENMLLAATALGYASCWYDGSTRMNGNAEKIAALLNVPENLTVRTYMAIGVPETPGKQASRKPMDERVVWVK